MPPLNLSCAVNTLLAYCFRFLSSTNIMPLLKVSSNKSLALAPSLMSLSLMALAVISLGSVIALSR